MECLFIRSSPSLRSSTVSAIGVVIIIRRVSLQRTAPGWNGQLGALLYPRREALDKVVFDYVIQMLYKWNHKSDQALCDPSVLFHDHAICKWSVIALLHMYAVLTSDVFKALFTYLLTNTYFTSWSLIQLIINQYDCTICYINFVMSLLSLICIWNLWFYIA